MQNLWLWRCMHQGVDGSHLVDTLKIQYIWVVCKIPATSLLSSATNIQKESYTSHSLLWILLICYLPFQQRNTDFLNYTAHIKLCDVENPALHGCNLKQVLEKMSSPHVLEELLEKGVDMSSIWNPNIYKPAHSQFGGCHLFSRCHKPPPQWDM